MEALGTGQNPSAEPDAQLQHLASLIFFFFVIDCFVETARLPQLHQCQGYAGYTLDGTANGLDKYMNVLQQEPVTIPQQDQLFSTMAMLRFAFDSASSRNSELRELSSGKRVSSDEPAADTHSMP